MSEGPAQPNGRQGDADADAVQEKPGSDNGSNNVQHNELKAATPNLVTRFIARAGLDAPTLISMFKGGLAPVISLAIFQSDAIANEFQTFGYLIAIISVLSLSVLPRGKYVQTLVFNLLFLCIGAAVAVLILWSALQARLHTQTAPPDPRARPPYNSSQSAVSAVWLFANIWIVNTLRAKYPGLNVPVIVYSILTNIACTFGTQITTTAGVLSFVRQLLTAMLLGFGIATGVSLLIFPVPSRAVSAAQMKGAIMLLRGALLQEKAYLQSLEREDMFAVPADICAATHLSSDSDTLVNGKSGKETEARKSKKKKSKASAEPKSTAEAKAIKETMFKLRLLTGKLYADLPFAKRDIAWAKLAPKDLTVLMELFRGVVVPIQGIGTVIDIFQRLAERRGWITTSETPLEVLAEKNEDKRVWNEVMKQLHEPFEELSVAIDEGLQHAGMHLEILPRPKVPKKSQNGADIESRGDLVKPGDRGFGQVLKDKIHAFRSIRGKILATWAREKGLLPEDVSLEEGEIDKIQFPSTDAKCRSDQGQLYILLYIETLMEAAGDGVLRLVQFADDRVADGTMARKHLMFPRPKVLRKWIASIFEDEDKRQENDADLFDSGMAIIYMGDSFAQKRDPEHLPPSSAWQRAGNMVRVVSRFFSSEESAFGFRCACATLTIGIVAFLERTHAFFQEQRLVWAMIIIAIGMTQTSGQSIFGFFCRTFGTFMALVFTLITWYIVDEKVPGIFVFLYLFQAFTLYFLVKYPQFIPAVLICLITQVLIIGYELQVIKIGVARSEATGQPYYPIYILGPYRLAIVAGGCLVAFIWTIFPSPVTERTWLRRDLAATLYLLANYSSVIHETLRSKMKGTGGDRSVKGTPAHQLAKHRRRLFGKLMLLLPSLKQHADFQRWEPTIGGSFPRELYEDIIQRASRITSYLTLLSYTIGGAGKRCPETAMAETLSAVASRNDRNGGGPLGSGTVECGKGGGEDKDHDHFINNSAWLDTLSDLLSDFSPTQHGIVCTLTLLSNALQSGHSIPPHLKVPRPYELTRQLEALNAAAAADAEAQACIEGSSHSRTDHTSNDAAADNNDNTNPPSPGTMSPSTQSGYAEFAVLQVCSTLICDDLEGIVKSVSKLVGVVDFSFCVRPSSSSTSSSSSSSSGSGSSLDRHVDTSYSGSDTDTDTDDDEGRGAAIRRSESRSTWRRRTRRGRGRGDSAGGGGLRMRTTTRTTITG
ncbi:hypothetical protein F5Y17DRAFT_417375 [Xylariaceae sp. FL0594]|nr:hypothetical protein F5Y17DRAFT_417375 [Xylariaceae sp. FL0594]